jgi:hypothetical protein
LKKRVRVSESRAIIRPRIIGDAHPIARPTEGTSMQTTSQSTTSLTATLSQHAPKALAVLRIVTGVLFIKSCSAFPPRPWKCPRSIRC